MRWTPHDDVNAIVLAMRHRLVEALGDDLLGIYLTGSLAWGGYAPGASDIDALVAIAGELAPEAIEALRRLHAELRDLDPPLSHRMDVPYLTRAELARAQVPAGAHPLVDSSVLTTSPHTSEQFFDRYIARERGIVLYGPPPAEIIAPVTAEQLREATRDLLRGPWARNLEPEQAEWLSHRHRQAFAILTMCRALHTLETGELLSKPDAAAWALGAVDPRWHPLIRRAPAWRFDRTADDATETAAFMRWTIETHG